MVAIGLISFLGQLLLTVSLKVEEAGKVSIIRKSADILFAFAFQIIIFEVSWTRSSTQIEVLLK